MNCIFVKNNFPCRAYCKHQIINLFNLIIDKIRAHSSTSC